MMEEKLKDIKSIIEHLNYNCKWVAKGQDNPYAMLLVSVDEEEPIFAISILPLSEDLEGSLFVQFYYEYPIALSSENFNKIADQIHLVNRQLPLGHFNFNLSNIQVYYKYVLAMDVNPEINTENFSDIIDMVVFAISNFKSTLLEN